MRHELKLLEHFEKPVLSGEKNFEVRKNDRGFQAGDEVCFKVMKEHYMNPIPSQLNEKVYKITYVLSGWGIENGYVVFGIKEEQQ